MEMTREIEKNDVDISQLFKWSKPVEIEDTLADKSVTLYLRLVGDADLNRARTESLRASGVLRKQLKDPKSDQRSAFLAEIDEAKNKETLVSYCQVLLMESLQKQAIANIDVPRPKELKADATLEQQEKYQKKVDEYPKKFADAVTDELTKLQEEEGKRLNALTKKQVHDEYESLIVNRLCNQEMLEVYYDHIVFHATYSDEAFTTKTFETYEAYDNVASQVKEKLTEEYKSLELGIDVVKKLPEAQE
jgi:hypothetical protein